MLNKMLLIGLLYDFYGLLLTDKQQKCIELYYLNDLSLAEIADDFSVSRQAVYDLLRRSEQLLAEYEESLGLVKRYQWEQQQIRSVINILEELKTSTGSQDSRIDEALTLLGAILKEE